MHATEHPGEPAWIHRSHEAQPKSATPSWMAPELFRSSTPLRGKVVDSMSALFLKPSS
jgi:hypothetical protein